MLVLNLAWGFLARSKILNPYRVTNRKPLAIASPRAIVSYVIRQGTLGAGRSLTQARSVIHLTPPRPIKTYIDVLSRSIMMSSSTTRLKRIFRSI